MYDKTISQNNQVNVINDCPESFVDLTSTEPAPIKTWVSNPFDQLYKIEDFIYDNATPEIKEVIGDLQDSHLKYYTIDHLEGIVSSIKHNQLSYVRDAIAYHNILTKKLYKAKYSNFNQFSQAEIRMTASRCRQVIDAGTVTLKLIAAGHTKLPLNSTQAFALNGLDDERLLEVWEEVLELYAPHEITAEKIKFVAYPPEPAEILKDTSIRVRPAVFEHLVVNACKLGITVNDYLTYFIELQKCKYSLLLSLVNFKT